MTMDKELKESLNLSFKYLRSYGEAELLDAVKGWHRVHGDNKSEERESEDESVEEVAEEAASPTPTFIKTAGSNTRQYAPKNSGTEKTSKSRGIFSKMILGILAIWAVLIVLALTGIFHF